MIYAEYVRVVEGEDMLRVLQGLREEVMWGIVKVLSEELVEYSQEKREDLIAEMQRVVSLVITSRGDSSQMSLDGVYAMESVLSWLSVEYDYVLSYTDVSNLVGNPRR